ncbi:unnamed protein product [Rhizophagus irregularis]|nr:unnamed protein product [Rhizophagus irregularis]
MKYDIFNGWVSELDREFRLQSQHVVLIIDNASSHKFVTSSDENESDDFDDNYDDDYDDDYEDDFDDNLTSNDESEKLSEEFSEDDGTNNCKQKGCDSSNRKGADVHKNKLDIKQAIDYIAEAWENVEQQTIHNCWDETGIVSNSNPESIQETRVTIQRGLGVLVNEIPNTLPTIFIDNEI